MGGRTIQQALISTALLYYAALYVRIHLVERVPQLFRPGLDFRRDTLRGGGLHGFYVRLPRLAGRCFSDAKRIIPFRIMNCRFILRRILTAIRGLCRRRQQDSRKGCRLPASRRVFEVSRGSVANPRPPPACPHFQPEKPPIRKFPGRKDGHAVTSGGTLFYPGGCPCKTHDCPMSASADSIRLGPMQTQPLPSRFRGLQGGRREPPEDPRHASFWRGPRRMKRLNLESRSLFCYPGCSGALLGSRSTIRSIIVGRI